MGDLLPALEQLGVRTAALVHSHAHAPVHARRRGGEIHPFRAAPAAPGTPPVWRTPCLGRLLYTPVSPRFPLWLHAICKEWQPDLLHIHMPNPSGFWAMLLPRTRRLPRVVHWHADVVASRLDRRLVPAYRLYRPFEQRLLAGSRRIIATSPPYLAASEPLAPWRSKCEIVPLGLDPATLPDPDPTARRRADSFWPERGLKILAVGRLTYYKGYEVLFHALATLPEGHLCLVGEGEGRAGLEKLRSALHLEKRVTLLGPQPAAVRNGLLASCDLLCLPSIERTEAFGLVLLEAMRYGRPVIASDLAGSGVGWVVQDDRTGRLVKPGDPDGLAAALRLLADNPEQRRAMGQAGAARFHEHFHIHQVARRIKTIYGDVIAPTGDL